MLLLETIEFLGSTVELVLACWTTRWRAMKCICASARLSDILVRIVGTPFLLQYEYDLRGRLLRTIDRTQSATAKPGHLRCCAGLVQAGYTWKGHSILY